MAKPTGLVERWRGPKIGSGKNATIVSAGKTAHGAEIWHVSSAEKSVTLTTSSTSAAIMDDAVRIYSDALERLAKR